jgi:hypothetical protein
MLYSGRTCIGHILNRGKLGFEAFDVNDTSLGIFTTTKLAADIISTTAKVADIISSARRMA